MHMADRAGRHIQPVCLSAFKKLLNGTTHQGGPEARGRKRKLGVSTVRALDAKRRQLVDRTNGEIEITVCLLPCVPVCFVASCVQPAYLPHRAHHAP